MPPPLPLRGRRRADMQHHRLGDSPYQRPLPRRMGQRLRGDLSERHIRRGHLRLYIRRPARPGVSLRLPQRPVARIPAPAAVLRIRHLGENGRAPARPASELRGHRAIPPRAPRQDAQPKRRPPAPAPEGGQRARNHRHRRPNNPPRRPRRRLALHAGQPLRPRVGSRPAQREEAARPHNPRAVQQLPPIRP